MSTTVTRLVSFLCVIFPLLTFAGKVRTLSTNSQEMPVITMMTGRSTVLRFSSAPKKVIIGNQNYFSIEFIDSDVTIQPLANTTSNMFVYGDGFTYGFILKVGHSEFYDDLIFVRNKVPSFSLNTEMKTTAKVKPATKELKFEVLPNKKSQIEINGSVFKWSEQVKSFYADIFIVPKFAKQIPTQNVNIQILSGNEDLTAIKAVFEKDQLLPKTKNRVRVFASLNVNQSVKLKIILNQKEEIFKLKWKK